MKKTTLCRSLCLFLVLLMPWCAMAETAVEAADVNTQSVVTITFTPGAQMSAPPEIAELFDILSLQVRSLGKENFGLSVLLKDEEVLSAVARLTEDGLYAHSSGFYPQTIFVSKEDLQSMRESTSPSAASASTADLSSLPALFSPSTLSEEDQKLLDFSPILQKDRLQDPEVRKSIIANTGGDETYLQALENMVNRTVETAGDYQDADHDPANRKLDLIVTQKDVLAFMNSTYINGIFQAVLPSIHRQLAAEGVDMTPEDLAKAIDDALRNMDYLQPITVYAKENDIVALHYDQTVRIKMNEQTSDVSSALDYNRLTTDGNVKHSAKMTMTNADEAPIGVDGSVTVLKNGNYEMDAVITEGFQTQATLKGDYETDGDQVKASLRVLPKGEAEALIQFMQTKEGAVLNSQIDFYLAETNTIVTGADAKPLSTQDKPLFSLTLAYEDIADDGRFAAVNDATADTALQVAKLSPSEMKEFQTALSVQAMQTLFGVASKLPKGVFQMMFEAGSSPSVPTF